ncbi:DNA replication/repair protein RecF [Halocynthiibacter namhaensis]|uniref:DNA replication/repair protein RecF n=1 Tax=Halocynthiibacter namhaensis TaxID=1290553 RepID=UPI000578EB2B|nr:DNA replication/repair protein RecF [Halocynthiibacter namhaensis]
MTGLALRKLRLSHFRSHRTLNLDCTPGPVAIYGPNGAGKTNIIEAISMLSPGRGLRRAAADDMIRKPEALGWKIAAELQSLTQIHEIETWLEGGQGRNVRIDGKSASQVALGRIARVLWLVPSMDRLWLEGADGRRRFLDRMVLSFDPNHAQNTLTYEKSMRERNRLLKDQIRDAHWYRALEAQMAEAGAAIQTARAHAITALAQAQDGAETEFPRSDLEIIMPEGLEVAIGKDALADSFAASRPRDLAAGRTITGPHRADLSAIFTAKGVHAKECSTGEQKALLISLILANGRALAQSFGAPPILLLDEVAAHLDSNRRAALYHEITALGAQAFMTGTGEELFDSLSADAMRLHVSETDNISEVAPQ